MNDTLKTVDARGLACPQPVILTRRALAEGGFAVLEVLVDDAASRENVVRFATFAHCTVEDVAEEGAISRIRIRPSGEPQAVAPADGISVLMEPAPVTVQNLQGATVFISSPGIGGGDEQLAALLMRGFLYALTESEQVPLRIILMNGGVRLAVAGSESLVNLARLAERGVEILACGTCLEFYHLKEALAVGRISNMYEIANLLLQGRTLSL